MDLLVQQVVEEKKERRQCDYINKSKTYILKAEKIGNIKKPTESKVDYKKRLSSWKNKPLHGHD